MIRRFGFIALKPYLIVRLHSTISTNSSDNNNNEKKSNKTTLEEETKQNGSGENFDNNKSTASSHSSPQNTNDKNMVVDVGDGNLIKKSSSGFLDPSDDVVLEFARKALTREGRDKIAESIIWKEETTYPPILTDGKRNYYDYTDDIPRHVKPFWNHEWYQQREYFQSARLNSSWWYRIKQATVYGVVFLVVTFTAAFLRIWMQQPRELQDMRSELLQHSYGRVLELSAGHGQNIGLFPYAVHEIVMCDSNTQQLQALRYRIPKSAYPKYEVRKARSERLEEFADGEFDCVIDMFGLCHLRDPLMALRQMQRVVKPTGIILLLEHGKTCYPPVNWILDYFEKRHTVNTHGCKWNQPIMDYLKDSRLEIKELRNKHYGTTYYVVAYPENIESLKAVIARNNNALQVS